MPLFQIRGFARMGLLEHLTVPTRGPCSLCQAYEEAFSQKALDDELAQFETMLARRKKGPAALVAISGGKDSLSTLYLARKRGWRVEGYLFDNGFIPAEVIDQARRLCEGAGVELHVDSLAGAARKRFAREVATVRADGPTPCDACGVQMNEGLARRCAELGIDQVIYGTNFYASWLDRPSALAFHAGGLAALNLPYALQVTAAQARRNVKQLGGKVMELKGVSSNCRVPGLVQDRIGRTLGHVPELELLSLEVMVGHLPRAEALRVLAAKGG
jgi:PP-loop superfamily ATP-utilizing enzyme